MESNSDSMGDTTHAQIDANWKGPIKCDGVKRWLRQTRTSLRIIIIMSHMECDCKRCTWLFAFCAFAEVRSECKKGGEIETNFHPGNAFLMA